jgi:hypothetical protein
MPRFLCYCPDYPDSLEKRFSVRPQHLVAAKADLDSGVQSAFTPTCPLCRSPTDFDSHLPVMGSPFLPRIGTKQRDAVLPEGTPNIAGSFMIYRFDSIKERMEVEELIG